MSDSGDRINHVAHIGPIDDSTASKIDSSLEDGRSVLRDVGSGHCYIVEWGEDFA